MTNASGPRIAIIGAGNIGAALLGGIVNGGVTPPSHLIATVQSKERQAELTLRHPGVKITCGGNLEACETSDVVILAVKPHAINHVLEQIRWGLRESRILVSLAAAYPMQLIENVVGRHLPVFRAMPNIPVVVEEGATSIAANAHAKIEQREVVDRIFRSVGVACWVEEDQLHAVTALSGSGPAYIYMVIEAMIAGGLKMGLSHETATRLAEQTVLGAAKLVRETMLHPAVLRDQVVTPGGVTISAIHELEKHGLRSMLISAVETATNHSRVMTDRIVEANKPSEQ
ncbi:MAG: pyrroline-5-carboxylate reductase [Bryobacteraceae bacterium]